MAINVTDTYTVSSDNWEINIEFNYHHERADWENPSYTETQVIKVLLVSPDKNGLLVSTDITDFYFEHLDSQYQEEVEEYARDNY